MAIKGRSKAKKVLYVEGMKSDLLSVGQMCDTNYNLTLC